MLLALDTATRSSGIALFDGQSLVAELNWHSVQGQTVELAPRLVQLLAWHQLEASAIQAVAVAIGPGSYTGLRVALTLAKGMALAQGLPLLGVPTLDATAYPFLDGGLAVGAVVQAGRGQLCWAIYSAHPLDDPPMQPATVGAWHGWRTAYLVMGALAMVLLMLAAQGLRRDPAYVGLQPDGGGWSKSGSNPFLMGVSFTDALRDRRFWTIFFAFLCGVFSLMSVMLHIVPHATDLGIPPAAAAGILSTIGGVSMVGRFTIGNAVDRIGSRISMIVCFVLLIAVLVWLQKADELWMLYLFAGAYGFVHGGFFTVVSPIVAEYFGLRSHGLLFGTVVFAGTVGGFVGPVLAGRIFDVTTSYRLAFWVCIVAASAGLALILSLKPARGWETEPNR